MRIVVKITGKFIEGENLPLLVKRTRDELDRKNEIIVVHGGGKEITKEFSLRGIKSKFIEGLRVTDKEDIQLIEMILSGKVNKRIVSNFLSKGVPAVGVSGKDGGMVVAIRKNPELGYVGDIVSINVKLIDLLLKNGFVPIISPISYGIHGETLNINADTFASHVSVATNSQRLVFITDVMGILRKDGAIIKSITTKEAKKLIDEEVVANGMIPKVKGGIYAAGNGVKEVIIGTFGDEAGFNIEGTIIRREDDEES